MVGNNKREEMSSFEKEILHFLSLVVSAVGNVAELCNSLVSFWAHDAKREIIALVGEFQISLAFQNKKKRAPKTFACIQKLFLQQGSFTKTFGGVINTGGEPCGCGSG